jgi:hypothetical protein
MKLVLRDAEPRIKRRDVQILFCCNMVVALTGSVQAESEAQGIRTESGMKISQ